MKTFRSTVFKRAHQIVKNTGVKFSEALKKSWSIYRLLKTMGRKPTVFTYKKLNGEIREARGTIQHVTSKTERKTNYAVVTYFDLNKNGVRCFRAENLLNVA